MGKVKTRIERNKEIITEVYRWIEEEEGEILKKKSLERYYKKRGITKRQQGRLFFEECVRKFGLP